MIESQNLTHETYLAPDLEWQTFCGDNNVRILRINVESPLFRDVLILRGSRLIGHAGSRGDMVDEYSCHYIATRSDEVLGSLRVTKASKGPLDCEKFYPSNLLQAFRPCVFSGSKFVFKSKLPNGSCIARLLFETAFAESIKSGARLDIINAQKKHLRYYSSMGYFLIRDSFFTHPVCGTPSYVMCCPADPKRNCKLAKFFVDVPDPMSLEDVKRYVRIDD
jgi:hypothetical protein